MHKTGDICPAGLSGRKRRRPFGPWWMRQPSPSVLVVVLFFGVVPVFVALVFPAAQNLLSGPDLSVRFVLPNDYVGEFKVVLDPSQGKDFSREGREFVFRIPANGILRVISDGPLNSFDRGQTGGFAQRERLTPNHRRVRLRRINLTADGGSYR